MFCFLRKRPRERLFYLTMFLAVAYLEIIGTSYECWWWPKTAWNKIPFYQVQILQVVLVFSILA
jgi:hypothetical protein